MPPLAKKRKSHYSTTSSLELLNKPQSRRHTTHNERSIYDVPESPQLATRSVQRYGLRRQNNSSIQQSSEADQEQVESSSELDQEQLEPSPEPNREQYNPFSELNQRQSSSSSEGDQIDDAPDPSDDEGHVEATNIYLQDHKVEDQEEPQNELESVPYGGGEDQETQIQDFHNEEIQSRHGQSEESPDENSQHEFQDEREEETYASNPRSKSLDALQVVIRESVERGSRQNSGVTSPGSSNSVPETPQPTTRSRRARKVRQEGLSTGGLDAEMSDHNVAEPIYEGIAKLDHDLKDWLATKVQSTRWSDDWMLFYERAFELPKYITSPMPESFNDAFKLIEIMTSLFKDLENLPVDLETKVQNLRAATFTEIKGILNFNEVPTEDLDREIAGHLVINVEGYLLPHIAIMIMLSFRAYTQYGVPASTAFDDSLGLMVDCSERINALREYYESKLNLQRSWRLGIRAKNFKQALQKNQLREFLAAEAQAPVETPRLPPTLHGWTRSEESWLCDAWEQYDCECLSECISRYYSFISHEQR
ncbi:hypothetical protein N7507_011344 [Penicillium longicatenatum]|nr:hypothetical protein N7507_011344 [Penicillium longicatenatum]